MTQPKDILVLEEIEILNYLPEIGTNTLRDEIIRGLSSTPKYISPSFFYDEKGSELFEEITHLDEYYLSRTEKKILSDIVRKLFIDFENLDIIELGSGDSSKISLLLSQLSKEVLETIHYFPFDISQSAIEKSISEINERFNLSGITGVVTNFNHRIPDLSNNRHRLFCFLGSTIGNLSMKERYDFVSKISHSMKPGDSFILGADIVKDIPTIEAAYNDKDGVTAEFNKNVLRSVNKHIGSNFNTNDFDHVAFFNTNESRIEMHLKAQKKMEISLKGIPAFSMQKGETIHTENSYKFNKIKLEQLGRIAGLRLENIFSDPAEWFSLVHFVK